jgi:hypothetical protein
MMSPAVLHHHDLPELECAWQGPGEYRVPTFVDQLKGLSFVKEEGASSVDIAMKKGRAMPG